jgi:spermidine synthase
MRQSLAKRVPAGPQRSYKGNPWWCLELRDYLDLHCHSGRAVYLREAARIIAVGGAPPAQLLAMRRGQPIITSALNAYPLMRTAGTTIVINNAKDAVGYIIPADQFDAELPYASVQLAQSAARSLIVAVACVWTAAAAANTAPEALRVVHVEKSPYATVYVVDEHGHRFLRFDGPTGDDQSEISLTNPEEVPMEYLRVAAAGLAFLPPGVEPARALVIGAGGGSFPMLLRRHVPTIRIDAVDIDPVVLDVAQKFFGVKADDHLTLVAKDGAAFVKEFGPRYDLVLLDAYNGSGIPPHLMAAPFLESVRARVSDRGMVMANLSLDDDNLSAVFTATFARAFAVCRALRGHEQGNVVLLGTNEGVTLPSASEMERRLADATTRYSLPFDLVETVDVVAPCGP